MEKKFLRVSTKELTKSFCILLGIFAAMILAMLFMSDFDFEIFYDIEVLSWAIIYFGITAVFMAVYVYQYFNNVLEYGNFGFAVKGTTYSYSRVTRLVAVHRGRWGTYYHLYVGDAVVFKFSTIYENKNDFIGLLQKNGVPVIA